MCVGGVDRVVRAGFEGSTHSQSCKLCHMYICQILSATRCVPGNLHSPLLTQEPDGVRACVTMRTFVETRTGHFKSNENKLGGNKREKKRAGSRSV